MKIICPQCKTAYEIPADKIGSTGRKVKCASCENIWQVTQEDEKKSSEDPDLQPEVHSNSTYQNVQREPDFSKSFDEKELTDPSIAASKHEAFSEDDLAPRASKNIDNSDIYDGDSAEKKSSTSTHDAYKSAEEPASDKKKSQDADKGSDASSKRRERRSGKKSKSSRKSGVISAKGLLGSSLLAASIVLCFAAVQYREQAVRMFPDLAGLYQLAGMTVNLRGLVFKDIRTFREVDDGSVVLVVEGTVENITGNETLIPAIKLALRSQDTQEIHAWVVEPREDRLAPGDRTRFRARLNNPPERAADIQLRFVERQKKRASIR
ncbi:zinc-ribbon domain-containing protein [Pseudovibrio sp. Tun.PSC04-5.I4]|uniref:zinc-ribbon domain-containing protein n=1 Tax=Pseudovibrio sp. Tun.PSC04-5.I4 TaxID=1798213 RepID=UPI0008924710|nr:zinc-ribbon domain-containing protein [Pseudovibrio sp. Tun.PSC04-5.I4]SDR27109.1 MJ0042 family finger-like domain-containing protein [Pseudovibrio sp. Tun.PSC04-5.I4]